MSEHDSDYQLAPGEARISLDVPHSRQARLARLAVDAVEQSPDYQDDRVIVFVFDSDSMSAGLAGCSLYEAQEWLPAIGDALEGMETQL